MTAPVLRTPRLVLRPFEMADAEAVTEGIGNWDVVRWLSVVPHPYRISDARDYIAGRRDAAGLAWAICDETGVVGGIGLDDELGYWLARPAWRKGYGFEAANAVVSHWFGTGGGNLRSGCFEGNTRSEAVLRALFFRETDRSRRHSVALNQDVAGIDFTLTAQDWAQRMAFRITTDRLVLRPLIASDAAALSALAVPEVARNLAGMPTPLPMDAAQGIIAARRWQGLVGFHLAIEQSDQLIGILGCGRTPASVMYAVHPDHWGKGVATEALRAVIPAIFARLPVSRLVADHMIDNPASGAVLRKVGFREVGSGTCSSQARLEDVPSIKYALRREEAQA